MVETITFDYLEVKCDGSDSVIIRYLIVLYFDCSYFFNPTVAEFEMCKHGVNFQLHISPMVAKVQILFLGVFSYLQFLQFFKNCC